MDKRLSIYLFPLLVLFLFILTNCYPTIPNLCVYEGPPQPKEQVGTLQRVTALKIDKIDGLTKEEIIEMRNFESQIFSAWELLPGKHVLKISGGYSSHPGLVIYDENKEWDSNQEEYTLETFTYRDGLRKSYYIKGTWELEFTVEPGHEYFLSYETKEEEGLKGTVTRIYPHVEELKTREKVSTCERLKK
jgi:hypothetical protein